jgi:hypothetical protein
MMRVREERVPKKVLKGHVKGRRPVARSRGRWLDAVDRDGKRMLTCRNCRSAEGGGGWRRRIEEAKAQARLKRHRRSRKNRRRSRRNR